MDLQQHKNKMKIKRGDTMKIFLGLIVFIMLFSFVSAGVGIKWTEESVLIDEGKEACLTYYVYNPWDEDSTALISLSENLLGVLTMQETETKFVPAQTSSNEALPIKFCFKSPKVYPRNCLIGDELICEQQCNAEQKVYTGEVLISSVPGDSTGGSSTRMVVSAPLRIRVKCVPHGRDYTLVFLVLAIMSLIAIILLLKRKYGKPKTQRLKEEMQKLRTEMKKSKPKR